nr:MAG TPA: hypothetical protein [Caudoviricetes sp.]
MISLKLSTGLLRVIHNVIHNCYTFALWRVFTSYFGLIKGLKRF